MVGLGDTINSQFDTFLDIPPNIKLNVNISEGYLLTRTYNFFLLFVQNGTVLLSRKDNNSQKIIFVYNILINVVNKKARKMEKILPKEGKGQGAIRLKVPVSFSNFNSKVIGSTFKIINSSYEIKGHFNNHREYRGNNQHCMA